ncbi:hypothetical protein ASZ90_017355 [hydrocarbon metagenome]|uniref:Competence protein CoiA-like N-terminal domain-containing protein n=1 Tax=hydrocarbon metagenome TaxID=938273 RepID=A0A0W8E9I3_9ZZZZ
MEWAFDKVSQQDINAKDAIRTANRYTCPVCGIECTLRRGNVKKPYFAHINGAAPEACENYHPRNGTNGNNGHLGFRFHPFPKLYIRTYNSSNWYLEILIYDYPLEKGEISIPFGLFGQVKISIPEIKVGGIRIPVKTMESYALQTSDEVTPPYEQMICSSIDGLDQKNYNVFYCSDGSGMRLHKKQSLIWGQQYFIVWHMNLGMLGWLPNNVLPQEKLNTNDQWLCKMICLPDAQNPTVEKWVNNKLNYQIKHPPLTLSTLFPIPDRILDDGSLQISETKFIFLSIDRNTTSEDFHELIFVSEALPQYTKKINLCGQMPIIFALNPLPLGRTHLWIDGYPDISISLYHTQSMFCDQYIPGVEFTFQDSETNEYISSPAFSSYTTFQLKKILLGNTSLVQVSLPKKASVLIGIQGDNKKLLKEYSIPEGSHKAFEQQLKDEIVQLLGKGKLVIDFGNYGKVEVDNELNTDEKISLTDSNRKKLKWIIAQISLENNLYPIGGIKEFPNLKLTKHWFNEDDYILIKKLIGNRFVPSFLLPYIRSVIQEISIQLKLFS